MVAVLTQTDHASQVVLTPNQSLSWEGNMWVIFVFSMVTILFAFTYSIARRLGCYTFRCNSNTSADFWPLRHP